MKTENRVAVAVSTAFASFKDAENRVALALKTAGSAKADANQITAGLPVGGGAAFAVAVITEGKTAEGIGALLNTLGLYAFFEECGKTAGPLKGGKARTASVYYGCSAFKDAITARGFAVSFKAGTVTVNAIDTKEEKAAKKEKAAKEAKEAAEKALSDAIAKATEKAGGIPVENLPEAIAALIACHGIKAVAAHVAGIVKTEKAAQKAAA